VIVILSILAGIGVPTYSAQRRHAKDAAARMGLLAVELGVETYAKVNGTYPQEATRASLAGYMDRWPMNPWTKAPLELGEDVGDYAYTVSEGGESFELRVKLSEGEYTLPAGYPMATPSPSP